MFPVQPQDSHEAANEDESSGNGTLSTLGTPSAAAAVKGKKWFLEKFSDEEISLGMHEVRCS